MLDKEIIKLKKIKLKLNQFYQSAMDQMDKRELIARGQRATHQLLLSNRMVMLLMLDKETIKLKKTKQRLNQFYQFAMELMDKRE